MPRQITSATSLDTLKKEAKRWLAALRQDDPQARERLRKAYPDAPGRPVLRDVQHALACEYGQENWKQLKEALERRPAPGGLLGAYEQTAADLLAVWESDDQEALDRLNRQFRQTFTFDDIRGQVRNRRGDPNSPRFTIEEAREIIARQAGFATWAAFVESITPPAEAPGVHEQAARDFVGSYDGDAAALERLNGYYRRNFTFDDVRAELWRRVYAFRQRSSRVPKNFVLLDEARLIVAQDAGFSSWDAFTKAAASGAPPDVDAFEIDARENRAAPRRRMKDDDWDRLIDEMRERGVTAFDANGLLTDAVLARLATVGSITRIHLGGSRELTDDGLAHLARMPQLEHLDLSEYPGGRLTDRGLEVLRHLPNLRNFEMTWQAGISDAGAANLRFCDRLENVNLMGSPTGDGAIEALQGKPLLRRFSTGRLTTDTGLRYLRNFPLLKNLDPAGGARLLLDGPFTNDGLAGLAGLEGVAELDLFWHVSGISGEGFTHLKHMPNLEVFACDGDLCDDHAMREIAQIPRLRRLRAQEAAATDDGFEALSRSQTLEGFWGRVCPHFGSRGFLALSKMPALHGFGVGLQNVDDSALATLPQFPALRELTPIGMQDPGFRHVGRCERLEKLTCMYCRDSGDAATGHIAGMKLKYYYAGLTQITDRSLEILGAMDSLEQVEIYECKQVTDRGLPFLARLPRLREVHLDGLPGVTLAGTRVFPEGVRVRYST